MKLRKNQTGFSAVEVLLVLILLAIVGFAGYYVYHAQKAPNKASTSSTSVSSEVSDSTKYATVSEWNIKVPETSDTGKITYAPQTLGFADPRDVTTIQFYDDELSAVFDTSSASGCGTSIPVYVAVTKYKDGSADLRARESDSNVTARFVTAGGYTYEIDSPESVEGNITDGSQECYQNGQGFTQADSALKNLAAALSELKPQN